MNGDARGALKQAYDYAQKITDTDTNTKMLIIQKIDSLKSKIYMSYLQNHNETIVTFKFRFCTTGLWILIKLLRKSY